MSALVEEVKGDNLEVTVNGVTAENASDVVWERLRLLEHVMPIIAAQTKAPGVNEVPLAALHIETNDLFKSYIPLAINIQKRVRSHRQIRQVST